MDRPLLTLGVPKGRIANEATDKFRHAGIDISPKPKDSRAMFLPTNRKDLQTCPIRSKDVALLLESKVLDMAIIGSDVLFEVAKLSFGQKIDLDIGQCRMSLIGLPDTPRTFRKGQRVKVATKYPRAAHKYFGRFGIEAEVISLNGSSELAPLTGLAPYVIDIVSTGQTLARNNLIELDHVSDVSSKALIGSHVSGERRVRCAKYLKTIAEAQEITPPLVAKAKMSAAVTQA